MLNSKITETIFILLVLQMGLIIMPKGAFSEEMVALKDSFKSMNKEVVVEGEAPPTSEIEINIYLKVRNYQRFVAYNNSKQRLPLNEENDLYDKEFNPNRADYSNLERWIESKGLSIIYSEGDGLRTLVRAKGTVRQLTQAFQKEFVMVYYKGKDYVSIAGPPSLPNSIASIVKLIDGLQTYTRLTTVRQSIGR